MLVQYHYPNSLSQTMLDRYLAGGWFRNCQMLYRSQIICLEDDVFSLVNIRLRLQNYTFKKRLRKLLKKNNERFTYKIDKASVSLEKELLYQQHKNRFKGFMYQTLEQFFYGDFFHDIFDTYEICVYDGDKLVAVSFFDEGKASIASLLCIYDQKYKPQSLGLYTMLLEIEFGIKHNKRYYYPGYVLDRPSIFDYKLRLGDFQHYNWNGRWLPFNPNNRRHEVIEKLRLRILEIEASLKHSGLPYQKYLYPFFSMGYLEILLANFLSSPIFFAVAPTADPQQFSAEAFKAGFYIIEYHQEADAFRLCRSRVSNDFNEAMQMQITNDYMQSPNYFLKLLHYEKVLYQSATLEPLLVKLKAIFANSYR